MPAPSPSGVSLCLLVDPAITDKLFWTASRGRRRRRQSDLLCAACGQAREIGEEGRNLKFHFFACGSERYRFGFRKLDLVTPGIDLDATTKRQSRDLVEAFFIKSR